MNNLKRHTFILAIALLSMLSANSQVTVKGDLMQWHKVTLEITGPQASESGTPNPFSDYKLTGIFTNGTKTYTVPGYFAADGNAANTSAKSGNIWRVHFSPSETGTWNYTVRFRSGTNVAINDEVAAGTAVAGLDELSGSFDVVATNKTGRDLRGKGKLEYVGEHHLRFAGNGEWFLKAGADSPENLFDYADFDDTPDFKNWQKTWGPHVKDWREGDPTWKGDKGKGLIGAVNYLSSRGANAISFLTMNVDGDDKCVFPWDNVNSRDKFDCSKLDQWEIVMSHAEAKGMYLHFKTSETENETLINNGDLGRERKLYYRELIARFSHRNALNWNMGEENGEDFPGHGAQTTAQQIACIKYFHDNDPYKNNIVLHTAPGLNSQKLQYNNLIGNKSELTGTSIQTDWKAVHNDTKYWVAQSASSGKKWVVANDEQGHAQLGVPHDDYTGFPNLHNIREKVLWGNFMAGGAGVEYYFGYGDKIDGDVHDDLIFNSSDMRGEDFRTREKSWRYAKIALDFFNQYAPFWEMQNNNGLTSVGQCLYLQDKIYVVYLPAGGNPKVTLGAGTNDVSWYNPRTGGELISGSNGISGSVNIGNSPNTNGDWVALIQKQGYTHPDLPNAEITGIDEVMDIELSETSIGFGEIWESKQLTADIYPGTAKDKSITWTTSNRYVATVTSTGLVRATGVGNAVITATTNDGGYTATCAVAVGMSSASITYGNNYVVFEAEATNTPLDLWVLRRPGDPKYMEGTRGVGPINETYLEFTGNDMNGGAAKSPLVYKFTAPKTGDYRLTMRMLQNLEGAEWDKCNDVYIKLEGSFTPGGASASMSILTSNTKLYGRGKDNWGSMVQLDVNHTKYIPRYNLIEGEEYTLTVSGRAQRTCIDYILFYENSLNLKVGEEVDVCTQNPEEYRPQPGTDCGDDITFASYTDFPNISVSGFSPAYKDGNNNCLGINAASYKDVFAAANRTFVGETGIYNIKLTTLTETDGESTYRVVVGGKLIGSYQNPETTTDYAPSSDTWNAVSVKNGDVIQVEFNSHTNGKIPEGTSTAYSRGRWTQLSFEPVCGGIEPPYVFVDSISVVHNQLALTVGHGIEIDAIIYPDEATNTNVIISSSDSTIVDVDADKISALKPGVVAIVVASEEDLSINHVISVVVSKPSTSPGEVPMIEYDRSGITAIYASSENQLTAELTHLKEHTLDGDPLTKWHTEWTPVNRAHPHEIWYDLGEILPLDKISLLPRQENMNGEIKGYELYISNDTSNWGAAVKIGETDATAETRKEIQYILLDNTVAGRYVRLKTTSAVDNGVWASLSEIYFAASFNGITISTQDTTVDIGETFDLYATIQPVNDTINNEITWASTNPSVATVDANGFVMPVGGGITYVTASAIDGYLTDSCMVAVAAAGTNIIGILTDTLITFVDSTYTLSTVTIPEGETVSWESLSTGVVTVNADGMVTGIAEGQAKIVASMQSEAYSDTCVVNVVAPFITIDEDTLRMVVGEAFNLSTAVEPVSAGVNWSSMDEDVASIFASVVIALTEGTTKVAGSIFSNAYSDSVVIEVSQPKVVLSPRKVSMFEGDSTILTATATPDGDIIWSSVNPEIADVDLNGKVKSVSPGRTLIKAESGTYSAVSEVFVVQNATLNKDTARVELYHDYELYSTLAPEEILVEWKSADESVATVSEGVVTGKSVGITNIIVLFINESDEVLSSDTCVVKVAITPPEVVFNVEAQTIYLTETFQLSAIATPDSFDVSLRSSNEAVAIVNENGLVTAKSVGMANIIAELSDKSGEIIDDASCAITVAMPTLNITLANKTITIGESNKLAITKTSSLTVIWTSSDEDIATVSSAGQIRGKAEGQVIIAAEIKDGQGNVLASDECTVTVEKSVGIIENEITESGVTLYPNPSSGIVYIKSAEKIQYVSVVDMAGNTVMNSADDTSEIDLTHFKRGVYFVRLVLENDTVVTNTVVIE